MKYGIKWISNAIAKMGGGPGAVKTIRGWEKWLANDNTIWSWPAIPPYEFDNMNDAFRYKQKNRFDMENYYYIVEELEQ